MLPFHPRPCLIVGPVLSNGLSIGVRGVRKDQHGTIRRDVACARA